MSYEVRREPFVVSTDPQRLDVEAIHAFLVNESYWARGISRATLDAALANSLCFGLYEGAAQVGFARAITDRATYAYINDVFVLAPYRSQGLASWLIGCIREHPDLAAIPRFSLHTRNAQAFYARFGFGPPRYPERYLEWVAPNFYGPPAPETPG